ACGPKASRTARSSILSRSHRNEPSRYGASRSSSAATFIGTFSDNVELPSFHPSPVGRGGQEGRHVSDSSETALGMRATLEWRKGCIDRAPAERADFSLDQSAAVGKCEIGTTPAAFVLLRVVLIPSGGLCEFLLILGFVILGFSSCSMAAGHGGGNTHCFDKS